jgi:iron complex outermembrane receptor protein
VLKGLSYQRILLLYNHLPRDGDFCGEDHGHEVPARYFFLVLEVVLGPQAVRYGSGALGGVVHYRPFLLDSTTFFWQWQGLQNPAGGSLK